ncbi:MAG: thioredoxin TrxC [Desulfatiglans sp.]|jgi:thioredoxin 2|nr:thioredoxin TrxC [Thermodesulfobacteriota bacterium]MEE4354744.1 thioredoxin TrxC [Desulfatiglans sp.]
MAQDSIIARCNRCGAKNRIPASRLGERPVCGKCKAPLSTGTVYNHPVDITDDSFHSEVLSHPGSVLVDCWAPWCGPCRTVAPILEQLADEYAGRVKIAKLNVDENPRTASQYSIRSIPTMLLFKDGRMVDTLVGALPKADIERSLSALTGT